MRKAHKALQSFGEFKPLYAEKGRYPFVYERMAEGERIVVALNPANRRAEVPFPLNGKILWKGRRGAQERHHVRVQRRRNSYQVRKQ